MLLNRGLEVSGLDFEDVETGKAARDLDWDHGRWKEKQVQYIEKIFDVQEARRTEWRPAQVTAVTNGLMGFGMHTGVRILRRVQTMGYQLCRVWTGGTRARAGEETIRICCVAPR